MLCLGSLKIMKWRQLFWIALCVVELSGNTSGTPTPPTLRTAMTTGSKGISSTAATGTPGPPSSANPTPEMSSNRSPHVIPAAATSPAARTTFPGLSSERTSPQLSRDPTQTLGTPLNPDHTSRGVPTTENPATQPRTMEETPGPTPAMTSSPVTSGHPSVPATTAPLPTVRDSPKNITCHNVKEVSDTGAICLQLNESSTCKHFLEMKGSDLWSAICEEKTHPISSPCQIKLAKSEVDHDCMLLILVGETDPATDILQESHWEKFGIKSLKRGRVRNHQDFSQKTLIALVTSGLMLAFLGLAGYFLMKRRSWSPAGERLVSAYRWQKSRSTGRLGQGEGQERGRPDGSG
ncbi:hematopoietic progenitor cell antigen CD34 isoform X3 [Buteo buteo]|uniref:hematopoietic progenitor cell antigen CD34 isoform X3 n=2 Tax=Buteo buteo TaxID=30397 RepID=UPI003EBB3CA3